MRRESLEEFFLMANLDGVSKQTLIGKLLRAFVCLIPRTTGLREECRS